MGIVERELRQEDNILRRHGKHFSSPGRYESDISMKSPGNTEDVDPQQQRGIADMEALTVVWTRPWLIAAYTS
jgi:hypothetical protein